jgi:HEAT repeat protein
VSERGARQAVSEVELHERLDRARAAGDVAGLAALLHPDHEMGFVIMAVRALADTDRADAVPPLLDHLDRDERGPVRMEVLKALGSLGDERAVPAVETFVAHPSGSLGEAATNALARIGGDAGVQALLRASRREGAIFGGEVPAMLGREASSAAVEVLGVLLDRGWWMRRRAFDALVAVGSPEAAATLESYAPAAPARWRRRIRRAVAGMRGAADRT